MPALVDQSIITPMSHEKSVRRRGRPPKVRAGSIETRSALIRAGVISLAEKGFPATTIDEVLAHCSVPKGSFYHYFESKEAFGRELIEAYAGYFARRLDSFFLNESCGALDRLRAFTIDAQAAMQRQEFRRGCLVGNLGQAMGSLPESYRRRLIEILEDWQARTSRCLKAAQTEHTIPASLDCDRMAEFFWIGWEGAVLRAKLERRGDPLTNFAKYFFSLLEQ